ncbi:beta-galactosidase [Carboxylicivirga sediminis]|uniref:Beta-galactosidase n=2 Tax=Carboxylicivirga sediminis TaxID=2006564 RepID=A0A941F776_9BACT|nr:beta-galactosidase [Carboxylicivirga sediminis]
MPKFFLTFCTCLMFALLLSCTSSGVQSSRFEIKEGNFYLDEQPIQLICGEMHYPRIPKEYWRDRMKRAKAMGINTVSAYVFWNYHERQPGVFDFKGQADIKRFIQIAQEEGLFVILRPGPYVCAEWDFGGYPWWLLKEEGMVYRSNDERFLQACQNYIQRLGEELSDLTVSNGGPILMVQVENEYGSYGADKVYLGKLRDMIKEAGFNVPLMTCDGAGQMEAGRVGGTLSTVNGAVGEDIFKSVDRFHPGGPYFVAEFYPAWFDVWGTPHSYRDYKKPAEQLEWMVKNNVSVSIYMFHGGTNFDYTNGANTAYGYAPQPTSYDYDAPLGEYGNMYPKYWAFREVLQQHLYKDEQLPEVPGPNPVIEIEELTLSESASLSAAFMETVEAEKPLCMEEINQDFGYIHYETILNEKTKGTLTIKDVRDYAVVLLNGKQIGSLDRRHRQSSMEIDVSEVPAKLEIIVENVGRVNYGADILNNRKGITEKVSINGTELLGWKCTSLPLYKAHVGSFNYQNDNIKGQPAFHRTTFMLDSIGDTFLDMSSWGKGAAWINGRSIGKFWNIGPQQTLYVPGPWLKKGQNELVIFAFEDTGARTVKGLKEPILDQLGIDKNKREKSTMDYSLKPVLESGDVVLKAEMTNEQGWQEFQFDSPVTMRHLALEVLSTNDGKPAGVCELDVIDKDGNVLTKDTWKVVYASSEVEDKGFAEYIIDGNLGTQWKAGANDQDPCVIVDLGEITSVSGIRLRHSYYEQSGRLKAFQLYGRPQFFLLKD